MTTERRQGARHPHDLEVELHVRGARTRLRAVDVSRHGLFVVTDTPPPANHAVLLTVFLDGGPFDTMASVVRRLVPDRGRVDDGVNGMGLKLFCLSADAKVRWDRFVLTLENPALQLPTRPTPHEAACFLVQLPETGQLLDFFMTSVLGQRTLYVSPAVHSVGAEVVVVLVHPVTHDEFSLAAKVVEWNADRPLRMGIRFDNLDRATRRRFKGFLGPVPGADSLSMPDGPPLLAAERPLWTEYAFYSPKLKNVLAPPKGFSQLPTTNPGEDVLLLDVEAPESALVTLSADELDTIEGQLLELPEMELVDKQDLFDFAWTNEGGEEPG